jgi:Ca2+-binding EF-hand superfamily protein
VQAFLVRLATIDVSDEAFQKLDTDHDGRISALEANASPKVAARFLEADRNHDGFLSREEFKTLANPPPSSAPP